MEAKVNQSNLADRVWLEKKVLPALSGKVLFVGVNYYTDFYHTLLSEGSQMITIDPDHHVKNFGSPHGHHVDTVENFLRDNPNESFDCSVNYGLFGMRHSLVDIRHPEEYLDAVNITSAILSRTRNQFVFGSSTDTCDIAKLKKLVSDSVHVAAWDYEIVDEQVIKPSPIHTNMYAIWCRRK